MLRTTVVMVIVIVIEHLCSATQGFRSAPDSSQCYHYIANKIVLIFS